MSMPSDLSLKTANHQRLAMLAREDRRILQELLNGISPEAKKTQIRENSFKALLHLSERHPAVLLAHWDYFISLLKSDNSFSKYAAIYIITTLVNADKKGRFEKAFNVYYGRLDDESVMVASHVAGTSGKIAKAKPQLQGKITKRLLAIDKIHFDAGRKDLIKSYVIAAFAEYFEVSTDQARILAFVRKQMDSSSPKTRKMAKAFLERWDDSALF